MTRFASTRSSLLSAAFGMLVITVLVVACTPKTTPSSAPSTQPAEASVPAPSPAEPGPPDPLRIVSLSPAISRTLVDFNLQDRIVGRTPHCASLDPAIPVVGDLLNVDFEALLRVQPTHILVQPPATGIDQHLVDVAAQNTWAVLQWRLDGVNDVRAMVKDLAAAIGRHDPVLSRTLAARANAILLDIEDALSPGEHHVFSGSVLMATSVAPVLAAGQGTYLDDMLKSFGGVNAVIAEGWVELTLEDITQLNPKAIILFKPTASESSSFWDYAGTLTELTVEGMLLRRLALVKNPDSLMPSSAVVGVARDLRHLMHSFQETPVE
jgi:ABC-type hemin transport system substrate-binding protein